jgi:lipopolysaccharide/colanic/teichoic acid biosynthesis glycosyltransferase/glycosyltransferase involved in cell wall biosynthesis
MAPLNEGTAVKVLHIVGESKFGGGSVIIADLAGLAQSLGWTVDVLTTDPVLGGVLAGSGVGVVPLPVIWRNIRPVRDLLGLWKLYRFLKRHRYELVHTHTSKGGFVGRLAARLAGVPAIVHTVHGFAFHEETHPMALRFYTRLERMAARWCDRIITVSETHRRWGLALKIADEKKMVAIPNGIPPERVAATRSRDDIRQESGAGPREFVILSTGRLAAGKGLEDLIDAAATMRRDSTRPFCVWLAGDGPLRSALERRVAALGLSGVVRFLGFRRDVGNLLEASDVVALPSLREGLSIALLEAMAAGKPIAATTIGSNLEVTNVGEAAQLVCPRDAAGLARAIVEIMDDPQMAEQLGSAAKRIYLSRYTQSEMLRAYADQYGQVLVECAGIARVAGHGWNVKRSLDLLVAGAALLVLSPVMLLIGMAISFTSPGAPVFRQKRLGRGGVPFTLYKFRTMRAGAPDFRNADGSTYNGPSDPRVTPLGRLLRATSLDELPQLINVVKGEMSLVGPRPELPDQLRFYSETDKRRLEVRPGITGLAQLNGRNALPWSERRHLDLEYLERRSLRLDLSILVKTLPHVLRRRGVYSTSQQDSMS